MKPRGVRVRTLICVIAAIAIVLAIGVSELKRRRLRHLNELVALYTKKEAYWFDQETAMRHYEARELDAGRRWVAATFASQALYNHDQTQYFGLLRRKYEIARRQPGAAIGLDPKPPSKYPRDYLSKVPYYVSSQGANK